jgi:CrcB protein
VIQHVMPYLLVGLGSAIGGIARFVFARSVGGMVEGRFPMGTLLINVGGSFVLGALGALLAQRVVPSADALRMAVGVGFCGGFTTFSTFSLETHALLEDGAWLTAIANMLLSVLAGLVAVRLGALAARSWL